MKIRKRWKLESKDQFYQNKKTVRAHTKSEARAIFKKILEDIPRIPIEMRVVNIPV